MKTPAPIVVLGSTGKTGRRVVSRLRARGLPVREGSRRKTPCFDWEQPSTWPAVLEGAERVYIAFHPDLAAAHAPATIEALVAAARSAKVKHLVLLSGRGEASALRCEKLVQTSGLDATIVRASWFFQNFSEGPMCAAVQQGLVQMPATSVQEPFVDVEDIADVVVAALTEEGHAGQIYEVTGPRLLTWHDAVAEIARAAGRPVRYEPITLEQFQQAVGAAAGAEYAQMMTELCAQLFDGRNASLADGVERAIGRRPADFADYCRVAAASGSWDSPSELGA